MAQLLYSGEQKDDGKKTEKKDDDEFSLTKSVHSFRSVTDLKSKGIHFRPSYAHSLEGIRFKAGCFYARLEAPVWHVDNWTKVSFLNMIAFELCHRRSTTNRKVISYIEFMKCLIDSPEDVKELREKKILFTTIADEEVEQESMDCHCFACCCFPSCLDISSDLFHRQVFFQLAIDNHK